jgi:hypothetical protein
LAANLPQLFSYLSLLDEFLILLITTGFGFGFLLKICQKQRNSHSGYFKDIKEPWFHMKEMAKKQWFHMKEMVKKWFHMKEMVKKQWFHMKEMAKKRWL